MTYPILVGESDDGATLWAVAPPIKDREMAGPIAGILEADYKTWRLSESKGASLGEVLKFSPYWEFRFGIWDTLEWSP